MRCALRISNGACWLDRSMNLRNTSPAFDGALEIGDTNDHRLHLTWKNRDCVATLNADLRGFGFSVTHQGGGCEDYVTSYR